MNFDLLDYDPDGTHTMEIFDDYFDLDDEDETRSEESYSSIEQARWSSQEEDQISDISEKFSKISTIESEVESEAHFSPASVATSEEAVPRRKPRKQSQRPEWTTIQEFDHEDDFENWFGIRKQVWKE